MSTLPVKLQPLTKRKAWNALAAHFNQVRHLHLRDLFAQDPKRGERMTLESAGLYLDYSKNRITNETLKLLLSGLQFVPTKFQASGPPSFTTILRPGKALKVTT
jgi:hypothetical protein